jgi:hypothetical protein
MKLAELPGSVPAVIGNITEDITKSDVVNPWCYEPELKAM